MSKSACNHTSSVRISTNTFAIIKLFFFYGYVVTRDLHSFPTRRSSDLVRVRDRSVALQITGSRRKTIRVEARDRKSTRLNSSHTVISYAVFCLKKKK